MHANKRNAGLLLAISFFFLQVSQVRGQGSLPTGWLDQDIGTTGQTGGASYSSGVFSVTGAGSTLLSGTSDGFHFAYQSLSGDGTIVARIVSVSNTSTMQAGVMIRETLTSGSTSMTALTFGSSPIYDVYRATTGAGTAVDSQQSKTLPYWIKVVRSGSTFTGYIASDGVNWVQLGASETISMAQNVYIGLAVTSQSTSTTATATFDNVSISTPSSPAPVITGVSATTASVGSQVIVSGSGFGASQGSSQVLLHATAVTINSWSASSITMTVPAGATSGYLVVSVGPAMNDSNPVELTVEANPLPVGWLDQDIGVVGVTGSSSYTGGVFSVTGGGATLFNTTTDAFHFAYLPLSGDGTIVARMVSVGTSTTEAGVIIRETLTPGSTSMMTVAFGSSSLYNEYRATTGGTSVTGLNQSKILPYWIKVVRSGSTFTGYIASDGVNWVQLGASEIISMAQNVYIGLGVTSQSTSATSTATFDNVSISTPSNPAPVITGVSATTASVGSQVIISGSGFGASQGSSQARINAVAATINSWSASSITMTVPAGATSGYLVVSVGPAMNDSNPVELTVEANPLPVGWLDQDIGVVGVTGSSSYTGGVFSVTGGGATLFNTTTDAFHFAYLPLSGDGTIVARMVSVGTSTTEAGVIIRETLTPGSTSMMTVAFGSSSLYNEYRATTGGTSVTGLNQSKILPYWIKVVRSGSTFTGYIASDGVNWVQLGASEIISMAQNVYIGLGVTSQSTSATSTATFDNVSISTPSNPAPVITGVSATTASVGSQVIISGSGFGASQGSSQARINAVAATINSWSASSITMTVPAGATSGYLVVSVGPAMNDSNPVDFTVETNPLPTGWLDQDVGLVGIAGSAGYSNGAFTISGAGLGLYNYPADSFHFAYQSLSGDGTIIARIVSVSSTVAMVGVMIRESLDPSANSMMVVDTNTTTLDYFRTVPGVNSGASAFGPSAPAPYWVKLVRSQNTFVGYASPDGISWTLISGPIPIQMDHNVYIGLAVSSRYTTTAYTATFDNVSISTAANPVPQITGVSATTGSVGSQVVISGTGFGASQGTSQVLINDLPMSINSWSNTSITITIASGATSGYLNVLLGPNLMSSNALYFTVTGQPLPAPWLDQDIGVVGKQGSATFANGTFTVQAAGGGVTGQADGFHFVYQPLTTDGLIQARIVSLSSGTRAGVMIRETLDAYSAETFSYMYLSGTTAYGYMNSRPFEGGVASQAGGLALALPYYVRVVRAANQFTTYVSADGNVWNQIGTPQTVPTAQGMYVGIGVSSGNTSTLGTATIDTVSLQPGGSLANPVVTSVSPNVGAPGQGITISGSGFGASQGTSTVLFNGTAAYAVTWSDSSILAMVPTTDVTSGPVSVTVGNITGTGPNFTLSLTAQLTDSLGHQTTYSSTINGGQWALTNAQGSGCSSCTTRGNTQNLYDTNGNLIASTDPAGNIVQYAYDSNGNVTAQFAPISLTAGATTTYSYNSFGEVLTMTDPLGNVTYNTYDSHGNLLTVQTPIPKSGTAASVTQFGYNSVGELIKITDPLNHITNITYTAAGLISTITDPQSHVTTYQYDSRGNRTAVIDALSHQTTFSYDAGNRLTMITYPDTTTTTFGYDYRGRRTSVTDQNGKATTYAYDDADRLISVTDAATNVTQYAYDTENNLLSITDGNGHQTSFTYDAFGRVTQTTFPSNRFETYAYDAVNNLISKTDRKGQTIQYMYDALKRLTQKTYPDSTSVEYTYDLVGKVLLVNDPTGSYGLAYDNMGRLVGSTTQYSFVAGNYTTAYGYDANSNRTSMTDPQNGVTTYAYDTLNRLSTLTPPTAFGTGSFGFTYDALSRRTQMTRPNGVATNYTYDNLSRLLSVLHQLSGSTIDGSSYTVDPAGNRTAKTDQNAGVTSNYTYDPLYELTQVMQVANTTESYTYDPVGNRLSSLGVSPYVNNTSNELTSTPNASYSYDYNGNTTSKTVSGGTTNYTWDYENRLASVNLPGTGGSITFKYDPLGRRIQKAFTQNSVTTTTNYLYDGSNAVADIDQSGNILARYAQTQNIDEPLAELRSGTTSYYEADGLGSVTSLTSASGAITNTYTYDSFGNLTASTGSMANRFQYTAREFDSESGLYYYRARYYDPSSGRFLSEDPIGFKGGVAFYPYVSNSPTNRSDPFGLFPTWWHRQVTADLGRVVFGPKCISQAQQVADANAAVDDYNHGIGWGAIGSTLGFFQFIFHSGQGWASPGPHFPDKATVDHLHDKALTSCSLKDLGESLHSRQDSIAHGGWSSFDHYTHLSAPDRLAAGSDLAIGAMNDTINQLSEFKAKCLQCCQ